MYVCVGIGLGTTYPDVTLHPIFAAFLHMSSKDTGPDVNPNVYLQVDIEDDRDAEQATIAKHKEQC